MPRTVAAGRAGWGRGSEPRWLAGVDGLIDDLGAGSRARQAKLLREAMHLLIAAPPPLAKWLGPVVDVDTVETMLAAGATESAALALVPHHAGFMLSRGRNGLQLASIFVSGTAREEYTAEGDTIALALLAALVSAARDIAMLPQADGKRLN